MTKQEEKTLSEIQNEQLAILSSLRAISKLDQSDEASTLTIWTIEKIKQICDNTDQLLLDSEEDDLPDSEDDNTDNGDLEKDGAYILETRLSELRGVVDGMHSLLQNATDLLTIQNQLTPILQMTSEALHKYTEDAFKLQIK